MLPLQNQIIYEMMKNILLVVVGILVLSSCSEVTSTKDAYILDSNLFETSLGSKKVYGVRLELTTPKPKMEFKGYIVQLNMDENVWIDTLKTELNPNDTLVSEVIFGASEVDPNANVNFTIKSFDIES